MSTIVRYSSGATYTIVPNKVDIEKIQDLDGQYHIPYTSIVGMMRLGLGVQKITVSGDALDMSACLWHDVVAISFDSGTSYQTAYFAGVPYTSDCWSGIYPYALSLLASPLREGAAVRYPSFGYLFGNQGVAGISQAGNVNAFPIIHYLAPLFYAPLSNTLIDFTGAAVTFTRASVESHAGVTYPINTPIFDNGLYLAPVNAPDVVTWTPPASILRTIAMQIKSWYLSPWSIGGGGANGLTANQSNAETNTTGWTGTNGTLTRTTTAGEFYAGAAGFKLVSAGSADALFYSTSALSVVAGHAYGFSAYVRSSAARNMRLDIIWRTAGGGSISTSSMTVAASTTFTRISIVAQAPAGAAQAWLQVVLAASVSGEIFFADSLMLEAVAPVLTIWTAAHNKLTIDTVNNLVKWTDDTTTVSATFPTAEYFQEGRSVNIIVMDDTNHAVTVVAHAAGGAWYTATGTLAAIAYPSLTLCDIQGSIANLIEYPYVLSGTEYGSLVDTSGSFSSLSLLFLGNHALTQENLYVGNRYAGEIVKGSDKRLLNANGSDISALLGGVDIPIGAASVTITQSQGLSARWYIEVKRTDV